MSASSGSAARARHTLRNVIVGVILAVIIIVVLVEIPLPHPFIMNFTCSGLSPGSSTRSFPSGSPVSGSWSTVSGGSVTFAILNGNDEPIYSATNDTGSFSFTASNSPYTFGADCSNTENVSVHASYAAAEVPL
jgi:hypothetical protein